MSNKNRIEIGDTVRVVFVNRGEDYLEGTVIDSSSVPRSVCAVVKDAGRVFYVQHYESIEILKKAETEETLEESNEELHNRLNSYLTKSTQEPAWVSSCCGSIVVIASQRSHMYECLKCHKPCELVSNKAI